MNRPGQHSRGLIQRTWGGGRCPFWVCLFFLWRKILKPRSLHPSAGKNKRKGLSSIWKPLIKGMDWILVDCPEKVSDGALPLRNCRMKVTLLVTETNMETSCDSFSPSLSSQDLKHGPHSEEPHEVSQEPKSGRHSIIGKVKIKTGYWGGGWSKRSDRQK